MRDSPSNTYWQFDLPHWYQELNSSDKGLAQSTADKNLRQGGHIKTGSSGFKKDILLFIGQFKSPLMLLLIGAVILSAFLGDTSDVFIILFIILSAGILSFIQERNAGK